MVSKVIRATPKLDWWLQQILGTTSEVSVQKSPIKGKAMILCRTFRFPFPGRGPELEGGNTVDKGKVGIN